MTLMTREKFKCLFQVFTLMNLTLRYEKRCILLLTVINSFLLGTTHGQSYHFAVGRHQRNFQQFYSGADSVPTEANVNLTKSSIDLDDNITNSTVQQSSPRESSNELSQTAMDVITVVWYVATFLALAAFFMLMACSDRRCSARTSNAVRSANEPMIQQPPTPTPSYSEFAPPSYDSVISNPHAKKTSVFVISYQVDQLSRNDDETNFRTDSSSPTIDVCNINELQKLNGSIRTQKSL